MEANGSNGGYDFARYSPNYSNEYSTGVITPLYNNVMVHLRDQKATFLVIYDTFTVVLVGRIFLLYSVVVVPTPQRRHKVLIIALGYIYQVKLVYFIESLLGWKHIPLMGVPIFTF